MGFDYEIHYKPGTSNRVTDALSKKYEPAQAEFLAISSPVLTFVDHLHNFYTHDHEGQAILDKWQNDSSVRTQFRYTDGLLYFGERLFVPSTCGLQQSLINEFHSSPLGGHSGTKATLARLDASLYWPSMRQSVTEFVAQCQVCQQHKTSTQAPIGLVQPLPIPGNIWEDIALDFITHLPLSHGKSVIWVVVDRLTKYAHFFSLPTQFTAQSLAAIFSSEVYRLHGVPKSIVSDCDPLFLSTFWKSFFSVVGHNISLF